MKSRRRILKELKEIKKEVRQYKKLTYKDDLTGLNNRRKLNEDLAYQCEVKKRHETHFSVMLLDIDGFKKINDTEGHEKGDRVLRRVANKIKRSVRSIDVVYRMGGDEFVVILSHTKIKTAMKVGKRIRENLKVGISFGVVTGTDKDVILERADERMYEDKERGK